MTASVTTRATGFSEMAYVGEKPWHGLGQKLEAGRPVEEWVKAAGMDWEVKRSKIRYIAPSDEGQGTEYRVIPDKHVLFRSDTKADLGIVSDKYKVVQPNEVLEFFRDLVGTNGYTLETAGTLFDGRRFWALASVGEEAVVVGHDRVAPYLLVCSSCDGTLATTARFEAVRVVCNNTLQMALSGKSANYVTISHRSAWDSENVKEKLGLAKGHFRDFLKAARVLAKTPIKSEDANVFIEELLVETQTIFSKVPRETRQFKTIRELFDGQGLGSQLPGSEGTLWGLVNGVTEYIDHKVKAKTPSHQLASAWFGRGDDVKTKALTKALALV